MRKAVLDSSVALAQAGKGPVSKMVQEAVEVGIIVPSVLKTVMKKAGLKVKYFQGPEEDAKEGKAKHGAWVRVFDDKTLVAQAYSHDEDDALLQAVCAWMREEDAAKVKKVEAKASKK